METLWFWLVSALLAGYVILDGFDLGAGILHLAVARGDAERRSVLRSIGPYWDGNEVWLLAAGGTLVFAFPRLYASSFSGFYLPLMIVLWLLMLRGVAIEFRGHLRSPLWRSLWDAVFCAASALLAVTLGAALGNVVRGVPMDERGVFFEPLWTDFRLGPPTGILDWYTVAVGVAAFITLAEHGALWVAGKTEGGPRRRARAAARLLWWALAASTILITWITFEVQPHVGRRLSEAPWGYGWAALALAGLGGIRWFLRQGDEAKAFLCSCAHIAGMMASAAFGLYPYVLPANTDPALGLTVAGAAGPSYGLRIGLRWWIPGMLLAVGYAAYQYHGFRGRVRLEEEGY